MKEKKIPTSVGIACMWFTLQCGGGFATGKQYAVYYSTYGWLALITPFLTWAVVGIALYFIFEYCRVTRVKSYKDYAQSVFIKKISFVFVLLFDIWAIVTQIIGEVSILSGAGALFEELSLNYWLGVLAASIIVLMIVVSGAKTIMTLSTYLTVGLVICIVIIGTIGTAQNWQQLCKVVAERQTGGMTLGQAVKDSLVYAGVLVGSMFALCGPSGSLENQKASVGAAVGGAAINALMLQILGVAMISNFPEINTQALPVLSVLHGLQLPVFESIYKVMLFFALTSTGTTCAYAIVTRFKPVCTKYFSCGDRLSSVIIASALLLVGAFGSKFGLEAAISTGYGYLSKLAWPLGVLPAVIILPIRLHYLKKKHTAAHASAGEKLVTEGN
ncbi:hypothetical protein [Oscillibacter sp. GMB15532]|uniref:hypothetical protein n=1 Tax=Oscillibacter sp. GMB15532 TaxID=3230022 RepID=UPI0034DE419A